VRTTRHENAHETVGERRSTANRREAGREWAWLAFFAAILLAAAGCTFLVDFQDKAFDGLDLCEGGDCLEGSVILSDPDAAAGPDVQGVADDAAPDVDPCVSMADGAACGEAGPCTDEPRCVNGACAAHPKEAGTYCGYNGGCNCGYCNAQGACADSKRCPEGFNWDSKNKLARCCGGLAVLTNTNANCGVCNIVCKTAGVSTPQDCKLLDGEYLCVGCSANSECWSKCCSSTPTPAHCAASDCNTGKCPSGICPAPATCMESSGAGPNYCSY
jgi:hypothetical protein